MNDSYSVRRRPFPLSLVLLLGLVSGILLDRTGWLPGVSSRPPPGLGHTFDPFWEAWNLVDKHYVDRARVQPKHMTEGAIQGMLESLGDVGHTAYLTKEDLERLQNSLKGEMEGIGARISMRKRRPTVVNTLPGSPASEHLLPGDVLLEVDGKPVGGLPLQQIVEQVRGKAGTIVHLRILREGQAKPLDFEIRRAKVEVADVTWHLLPTQPAIAHVAIQDFGNQADAQLKSAVNEARAQGARGLILDVRGNPGGLKEQAVAVTSEFLKGGNVFIEKDAAGHQKAVPVRPGGIATEIPLCVLIDEGTASSAEIFAGALHDYHRGSLIGSKTFGTGTVLQPFDLSDGSAILLAVAEWLTPEGKLIWHEGIPPDIEMPMPQGATYLMPESENGLDEAKLMKTEDKQLLKALDVVKGDMAKDNAAKAP